MLFLTAFKKSGWSDTFYPVNPKYNKVLDWKCYPSVLDIPFPVDTAYVSLKTKLIPRVIKECVEKNVPWVIIYASGFSETGNPEGAELEKRLKSIIKNSKTRIIGPNCLGPFNGSTGLAFTFSAPRGNPGSVSFMSQSGGHLGQLLDIGYKRDIRFRYGVSFGNQIDLNCLDFLRHYNRDKKTKIIAAYLESFGSANGHDFFLELSETTKKKPVIIWKGGHTEDGSRAAFSHTGAIASNEVLWKAMTKQTGAVLVRDNEEWWNAVKTFELMYPKFLPKGRNVGIVTPGGGNSVSSCDMFAMFNLNVPTLSINSQDKIGKILPKENVNIKNPIDLGASGFLFDILIKCIEIVANDPNIDFIIIPLWPDHIYHHVFKRIIKIRNEILKPIAFCLPSIADDAELAKRFNSVKKSLHNDRILYYLSLRDAARSMALLSDYSEFLRSRKIESNREREKES
jgi:acyl-CoA synthetase (NDP forming)